MKVLILGATGRTGKHLVDRALSAGHHVQVMVRNPAGLGELRNQVEVFVGGATERQALIPALTEPDAVLVALGPRSGRNPDIGSKSVNLLADVISFSPARRLILLSAFGVGETLQMASTLQRLVFQTVLRPLFEDKARADETLKRSTLSWTLIRPVTLTDGAPTGRYKAFESGQLRGYPRISRADVAEFMVRQMTEDTWQGKAPILSPSTAVSVP